MGSYKKRGIITFIILVLLTIAIAKVNDLVSRQIDKVERLERGIVEEPKPEEIIEAQPKVIHGIVIEGPPPTGIVQEEPKAPSLKKLDDQEIIYEFSADDPILIQ